MKGKVYNSNPWAEQKKKNIRGEITNIPAEQLQKVYHNDHVYRDSIFNTSCGLWLINYHIQNVIGQQTYS